MEKKEHYPLTIGSTLMQATYILGLSAFFHDSAACLLKDGVIIGAAQEERFTRKKQDSGFPENAIRYCLEQAMISIDDVQYVGFYEKPHLKLERILSIYSEFYPKGFDTFDHALHTWWTKKFRQPSYIRNCLAKLSPSEGKEMVWDGKIIFCEHHFSHAASAFFPSPFQDAAILTLDGVGEWSTTTTAIGYLDNRGTSKIKFLQELRYPHSLGMLYSAMTYYLGFKVNSGEYKVMGLAPYGEPQYCDTILETLMQLKEDGSFKLNMEYFSFPYAALMVNESFEKLFGGPARKPEAWLTQREFDLAASIQKAAETIILKMANHLYFETGNPRLCLAGGVALNCVANGRILRETPFQDVWIQPAAGDAGGALGVAFYIHHEVLGQRRTFQVQVADLMAGSLLGPSYSVSQIEKEVKSRSLPFHIMGKHEVFEKTADFLTEGKIVGWFQGRMEFGPRALGARSILGDPRSAEMQKKLNLKIKFRESFRPFAPSVLREKVQDWFDLNGKESSLLGKLESGYDSEYMLLVAPVKKNRCRPMSVDEEGLSGIEKLNVIRSEIPSCTHVDYSARVQTVSEKSNPAYYSLIKAFERKTGVALVVNTSFNVRGEPIVCTPSDALNCFLGTDMDVLVMENIILLKSEMLDSSLKDYKNNFALD